MRPFLTPGSDIVGRKEAVEASEVAVNNMNPRASKKRAQNWTGSAGFVSLQTCLYIQRISPGMCTRMKPD